MKISNAYMFRQAIDQMSSVQEKLSKTQAQLAAGKQVLMASDAPDKAASIERYKSLIQRQESFSNTLGTMEARLQAEESALSSVSDILVRMKELSVQGANDTLGASDRQALATEMKGLREQMLSLANSQDSSGNHIFGGSRVSAPPFVSLGGGAPSYQGDFSKMQVPVGPQRHVALNRPGAEVFANVVRAQPDGERVGVEFFQIIDDGITALQQGQRSGMERSIGELDQLQTHIDLARAQIGTDQNVLQAQKDILDDTTLTLRNVLSGIEDLDYAKAVTQMQQQSLALQAAQSSFAKISQLNLFDYLR